MKKINHINIYINCVIKPLEKFRNSLLTKYKLEPDNSLILKIENDLLNKYIKLSKLINDDL